MIKRWQMLLAVLATVVPLLATAPALADCVDINADPEHKLTAIAHINDERAVQLVAGRPWPSVRSLTGINGIGRGRTAGGSHYNVPRRERQSGVPCVLGVS